MTFDKNDPRDVALRAKQDGRRFRSRFGHDNDISFYAVTSEAERLRQEVYEIRDPALADLYAKRFIFWALMVPGSEIIPPKSPR